MSPTGVSYFDGTTGESGGAGLAEEALVRWLAGTVNGLFQKLMGIPKFLLVFAVQISKKIAIFL